MIRARRLPGALVALVLSAVLSSVAAPAAQGQDASTAAISVDPTTGLVDGQHVTVTGSGWDEYLVAVLFECSADLERCAGPFGFAGGDDHGDFSLEMMVRTSFTDEDGPVDCRTEDCVIAAGVGIESAPREATPEDVDDRVVPVSFDPSAPLLDPPSLDADPASGLVDDQQVTLTGERYVPDEASIAQCPLGFTDPDHACEFLSLALIRDFGDLDERVRVHAVIETDEGPTDCRSTACVFAIIGWGAGETLATAPVGLDPNGPLKPPASLTVTPGTGLVDGQTVVVEGAHFTRGEPGLVLQCPATARNENGCAWRPHHFVYAHDAGTFRFTMEVAAVIEVRGHDVDCRRQACALLAGYGGGDTRNSAWAPISFAADAAPATPTAVTPAFTG